MNNILSNIIRCTIALLLQIFICNYIHLFGYLTPAIYLFALFLLPLDIPKSAQYLIAFVLGFIVDMFMHTLGVNAAACIILMFARPYIIHLLNGRKTTESNDIPTPAYKDFRWLLGFVFILSFVHQATFVMLETFSFHHFGRTLIVILGNTLLTTAIILSIEYLFYSQSQRA